MTVHHDSPQSSSKQQLSRPFSASDAKNIGKADVYQLPRLLGQQISAHISKIIGWADGGAKYAPGGEYPVLGGISDGQP